MLQNVLCQLDFSNFTFKNTDVLGSCNNFYLFNDFKELTIVLRNVLCETKSTWLIFSINTVTLVNKYYPVYSQ